jgi:hypothetical protein
MATVGTTIAFGNIGDITLPAEGPWIIHTFFGTVVNITATAANSLGGLMRFVASSGDLTPDPSPSDWPVTGQGSFLGATESQIASPLNMYNTNLEGAGKGIINLSYSNGIAIAAAPMGQVGLMYGVEIPEIRPAVHAVESRGVVSTVAETTLGTMTLSEQATRITGISGIIQQDGVLTTAEEILGSFRLSSDDVELAPSIWPFNCGFSAGLGALIGGGQQPALKVIPVDIPVPGGARIIPNVALITAVTNPAYVQISLYYE